MTEVIRKAALLHQNCGRAKKWGASIAKSGICQPRFARLLTAGTKVN